MRDFLNGILTMARGRSLPPGKPLKSTDKPLVPSARMTAEHAQKAEIFSSRLMALGVTQSQFSAITGVTARTVSNWVSGHTKMSGAAELVLTLLEDQLEVRRALCVGVKATGAPRGWPFRPGNPYRFGDRRRAVSIAGAQMARAAA